MKTESLAGWLPYSIRWESSPPSVLWCHLGSERLVEPFFDQTIERRRHDPNNRERDRITSLDALAGWPRLVNYSQLPEAVWSSLPGFFGASCSASEIETMKAASRFNAKEPSRLFVDDVESKRSMATDEVRAQVDRLLMPLYERLEAIRLSQP